MYPPKGLWPLVQTDLCRDQTAPLVTSPLTIDIDQSGPLPISFRPDTATDILHPLCLHAQALLDQSALAVSPSHRILIGIAGCGASGKSVFAELLRAALEASKLAAQTLSMDAFHLPNSVLDTSTVTLDNGSQVSMRSVKGTPPTIDVDAFLHTLQQCRHSNTHVSVPVYNRTLHDPVADAKAIDATTRIVVVEGLYLLHEDAQWANVLPLLDFSLYLDADLAQVCRPRHISRQIRGGRTPEAAEAHFVAVDVPNAELIARGRSRAHAVLNVNEETQGEEVDTTSTITVYTVDGVHLYERSFPPLLLAIGPNPALQKSLTFDATPLRLGEVNRASALSVSCGGKGAHFARAASRLARGCVAVAHFLGTRGSAEADFVERTMLADGVTQLIGRFTGRTRTCTTLLSKEDASMTELIEPSDLVSSDCVEQLTRDIATVLATPRAPHPLTGSCARGVAICGTYPPGVTPSFYANVARALDTSAVLLLDGYKGVDELLATRRVNILKVNEEEIARLTDTVRGHAHHDRAAAILFDNHWLAPNGALCITAGADRAAVYTEDGTCWEAALPRINCVNPIGAGDTCSAVALYRLVAHDDPIHMAFFRGVAAATASCLHMEGARFYLHDANRFLSQMALVQRTWKQANR